MSIQDTVEELVSEFEMLGDWQERYAHIIDLGRELKPLPEAWKTEEQQVKGCQSQVWMYARMEGDVLQIDAESDALIVQGLIAILLRIFSAKKPEEIVATKPDFVSRLGLDKHLSQNRSNGLHAMLKAIYAHAAAHL